MDTKRKINWLKKKLIFLVVGFSFLILFYSIFRSFEIVRMFLPDNDFKKKFERKIEDKCADQDFENELCELNLKELFAFDLMFIMKGPRSRYYVNKDLNIINSNAKMIHDDQVAVFFIKENKIIYRSDNDYFLDEFQFSNFPYGQWDLKITDNNTRYKLKRKWSTEVNKYIYFLNLID